MSQKLKKTVTNANENKVVDYLDGFQIEERDSRTPKKRRSHKTNNSEQYAGNVLQFFPTAEGYVKVTKVQNSYSFDYVFNYTDHLGNIRLSYTKNPENGVLEILDETHYYPFGLKHEVYIPALKQNFVNLTSNHIALTNVTETDYQYKYNGKELQDELDLNVYAYGWRDYDSTIGRFNKIDRFAEKHLDKSPYNYATNNPVLFVDVKGDSIGLGKNHFDKFKNHVESRISKVEKNRENRLKSLEKKGNSKKAEELKTKWSEDDSSGVSNLAVYKETLRELEELESSEVIYDLKVNVPHDNSDVGGFVGYDNIRGTFTVNLTGGFDLGYFSHELKHAYQYEVGKLSISADGKFGGALYDAYDELEAYTRSTYFGKPGMTLPTIVSKYRFTGRAAEEQLTYKSKIGPRGNNTIDQSNNYFHIPTP